VGEALVRVRVRAGVLLISAVLLLPLAACTGSRRDATALPTTPAGTGATTGDDERVERATQPPTTKPTTPAPKPIRSSNPKPVSPCLRPGSGSFRVAPGGHPPVGKSGRLYRYQVMVQDGVGPTPAGFAAAVDATLGGARGWTNKGVRFQRVSSGSCDFVVELATAATSEKICAGYGLHTGGEVSCRGGKEVVINLDRWLHADPEPAWSGHLSTYRDLVVNHEVGHFLGYHHMSCPGSGKPLPVMATPYTTGLRGCAVNGWPYSPGGAFLSGPAQPGN
jgi:Protein of unknown function (DUF3152)